MTSKRSPDIHGLRPPAMPIEDEADKAPYHSQDTESIGTIETRLSSLTSFPTSIEIPRSLRAEPIDAPNIRVVEEKINHYRKLQYSNDVALLAKELQANPSLRLANTARGTHLLVVHYNGEPKCTIKHLNSLLGPEPTNSIIRERHAVIKETLAHQSVIITNQLIDNNHHRTDTYSLSVQETKQLTTPPSVPPPESVTVDNRNSLFASRMISNPQQKRELHALDLAIKVAEQKLQTFVLAQAESTKQQFQDQNTEEAAIKARLIQDWIDAKHYEELTLSFGISEEITTEPTDPEGFKQRLQASDEGLMTARIHEQRRERHKQGANQREYMGITFDVIGMITDMHRCVENLTNIPASDKPHYFDITPSGLSLQMDIIEILRKGTPEDFTARVKDPQIREVITMYYRVINRFDCIKSWPDIGLWKQDIENKRAALASNDIERIKTELLKHTKPTNDMCEEEFHAQAAEVEHGYCITLDKVGMGNENVHSFEKIFWNTWQQIEHVLQRDQIEAHDNYYTNQTQINSSSLDDITKILRESTAEAGKEVTIEFYKDAAKATGRIEKYLRSKNIPGRVISATPTGDEVYIVVAIDETPTWNKGGDIHASDDALLLAIADMGQETNFRISATYKHPEKMTEQASRYPEFSVPNNISYHYRKMDDLDIGIQKAKKLEKLGFPGIIFVEQPNEVLAAIIPTPQGAPMVVTIAYYVIAKAEELHDQGIAGLPALLEALAA